MKGLKRAVSQEWSKVSVDLCVKTLSAWESRVKLLIQSHDLQSGHSEVIFYSFYRVKKDGIKSGTKISLSRSTGMNEWLIFIAWFQKKNPKDTALLFSFRPVEVLTKIFYVLKIKMKCDLLEQSVVKKAVTRKKKWQWWNEKYSQWSEEKPMKRDHIFLGFQDFPVDISLASQSRPSNNPSPDGAVHAWINH